MKRLYRWLWQIWFEFRKRVFGKQIPLRTAYVTEFPDELDKNYLYLIGENEHIWFATLLCPCGCETSVQLSLLPSSKPHWKVIEHKNGTVTLLPSVWRKDACRSHYFVRRGLIEWTS